MGLDIVYLAIGNSHPINNTKRLALAQLVQLGGGQVAVVVVPVVMQ